jgi:hypothetical protein
LSLGRSVARSISSITMYNILRRKFFICPFLPIPTQALLRCTRSPVRPRQTELLPLLHTWRHPNPTPATRSLILVRTTATAGSSGRLARERFAVIRKRLGRLRPSEDLRYNSTDWLAVVGEAKVEIIVMAGRRGTGAAGLSTLRGLGLVFE